MIQSIGGAAVWRKGGSRGFETRSATGWVGGEGDGSAGVRSRVGDNARIAEGRVKEGLARGPLGPGGRHITAQVWLTLRREATAIV